MKVAYGNCVHMDDHTGVCVCGHRGSYYMYNTQEMIGTLHQPSMEYL